MGAVMKTYQVELKRVAYVTMTLEADNEDQAEALAWDELASDGSWGSDAEWFVESIEAEK
jgi:hypothetical protein